MYGKQINELDSVAWEKLRILIGYATHVPQAIRGLLSSSEEERNHWYWQLDNHIVVQGTLYEAAYYSIPFLIGLLCRNEVQGKEEIYELLCEIANAGSLPEDYVEYAGAPLPLSEACKNAVKEGLPLYIDELMSSDNDSIVNKCQYLLLGLDDSYPEILMEVTHRLNLEQNERKKIELNSFIQDLCDGPSNLFTE